MLDEGFAGLQSACTTPQSGVLVKDEEALLHAVMAEFAQHTEGAVRVGAVDAGSEGWRTLACCPSGKYEGDDETHC